MKISEQLRVAAKRQAENPDYKVIEKELLKRFQFGFGLGDKGGEVQKTAEDLHASIKALRSELDNLEDLLKRKPLIKYQPQAKALLSRLAYHLNAIAPRLGGRINMGREEA